MNRRVPFRLPALLAVLALAGWLWAATDALGHRHDHDHDHGKECPTCVLASQSVETVHAVADVGVASSGTWSVGVMRIGAPEAADVSACARGPPPTSPPRS